MLIHRPGINPSAIVGAIVTGARDGYLTFADKALLANYVE